MMLTLKGYARHRKERGLRGGSHVGVLRAIQSGRLTSRSCYQEGGRWHIDPELADQEWAANTDLGRASLKQPTPQAAPAPAAAPAPPRPAPPPPAPAAAPAPAAPPRPQRQPMPAAGGLPAGMPDLATSRAVREAYQAKLLGLEYEQKSNRLADVAEVKMQLFMHLRQARDAVQAVTPRVVDELAAIAGGLTAEQRHAVMVMHSREMARVCKQISETNLNFRKSSDDN